MELKLYLPFYIYKEIERGLQRDIPLKKMIEDLIYEQYDYLFTNEKLLDENDDIDCYYDRSLKRIVINLKQEIHITGSIVIQVVHFQTC